MGAIAFVRRTHEVALFVARLAGLLVAVPNTAPEAALPVPSLPPPGQV